MDSTTSGMASCYPYSCPEEVGHVDVCYLLYGNFHKYLGVFDGRELNAINSSVIVPVTTTSIKM